ncbi:hypothetical protein D7C04_10610 [Salmonella enterica]|nr:hypothetical protein [Salmonella enterica]
MNIVFHIPEHFGSIPCPNNVRNYLNQETRPQEAFIQVVLVMRLEEKAPDAGILNYHTQNRYGS